MKFGRTIGTATVELRTLIENAVRREFTIERVGIEFVGFENCLPNNAVDAQIITITDLPSRSTTGSACLARNCDAGLISYPKNPSGSQQAFVVISSNPPEMEPGSQEEKIFWADAAWTAVHEFGHLAGIHHEDADFLNKTGQTERVSVRDPDSIMDYANGFWRPDPEHTLPRVTGLSSGDRHSIRCLYVYGVKEKRKVCRPDYIPHGPNSVSD